MSIKLNGPCAALTIMLSTTAVAQTTTTETQPGTTEPTTTETAPPTTTEPATTQTTTTQTQPATTAEPATTTTQTTTTQTGQVTLATAADVKAGASVYDEKGQLVGKVDSVSSAGVVVNTGKARAEIPLSSIGTNDTGLVSSITKDAIEAKVKDEKPKE
jgi:hypothetical protein